MLRFLALVLIVFLATLAAGWPTALIVTGIVAASSLYGTTHRPCKVDQQGQPLP